MANKLEQLWSPDQIAGWLQHTYPDDEIDYRVSHETIYRSFAYVQARVVALKKELIQHLRTQRTIRRSRCACRRNSGGGQGQIKHT